MVRQKWPVLAGAIQDENQDQHQDFDGKSEEIAKVLRGSSNGTLEVGVLLEKLRQFRQNLHLKQESNSEALQHLVDKQIAFYKNSMQIELVKIPEEKKTLPCCGTIAQLSTSNGHWEELLGVIGPELKKASNVGRLLNSSASLEELRHAFVASVGDVSNDTSPPAAGNNTASGFPADQLVKLLLTFGPAESPRQVEIGAGVLTSEGKSVIEGVQHWLSEKGLLPPAPPIALARKASPDSAGDKSAAAAAELRLSAELMRGAAGLAAPVAASTVMHPTAAQVARSRARVKHP